MAVILENSFLNAITLKMVVEIPEAKQLGQCGQFYMIRTSPSLDPILSRPISIYDIDEEKKTVTFIYVILGRGTELMSKMHVGDEINLYGPLGNPFPLFDKDITLIGGGLGGAPLYLLAKQHKALYPNRKITLYLGFADEGAVALVDEFKSVCDVNLSIGGYVTDAVDYSTDNIYYACGTPPMMGAACKLALSQGKILYISLDKHMACGVGACLVCTCKTADGTKKRACKEGPVFLASDVYDIEKGGFYE